MPYVSPSVPDAMETKANIHNYGKLENFNRLGFLNIPIEDFKKLPSGVQAGVLQGYEHIKLGIELFNNSFLNAPAFVQFTETSRRLKAKILQRSNSLGDLREGLQQFSAAVPALNQSNAYLHACDYYQRQALWKVCETTIRNNRTIDATEKTSRLTKLKFLHEQWLEQVAFAHYTDEQLISLFNHCEEFETALNDHLNRESYFNAEAKFFFDDVRVVLEKLKQQQRAIALAVYHRLRISNKYQKPGFTDPILELRLELSYLGIAGVDNSALDALAPRNGLATVLPSGNTVKTEFTNIINNIKYGTTELRARVTNLGTYKAFSENVAIPVTSYEENVFVLPTVTANDASPISLLATHSRLNEFDLSDSDLTAREGQTGYWNRWEHCRYKLFNHPDFRLFNACASVVRDKPFSEADAQTFLGAIGIENAEKKAALVKTLTNQKEAEKWIKANADRLIKLLDPKTDGSPVPRSWASFSWLKGTEANSTKKVIESYRRVLIKAKQGSLKYQVPKGLEHYIPFDAKDPGTYPHIRHDLFLGTTFIGEFNALAFNIKDKFDENYVALTANEGVDRLHKVESTLKLKEISNIEIIIANMELQIKNSMPSIANPFNWFSSEASKTKQMLREWQAKLDMTKRDLTTKKSQIAKFIADKVDKYIDETSVNSIDNDLLKRLGEFIDKQKNSENKDTFTKATTVGGVLAKYIRSNYFIRETLEAPKQFIAVEQEPINRILNLARHLSLDATKSAALTRVMNILQGKAYPEKKNSLKDDLTLLCGKFDNVDELLNHLIDRVIKPSWNPHAVNAESFMKSIYGSNQAQRLRQDHTTTNTQIHDLMLNLLNQDRVKKSDGVEIDIRAADLKALSQQAYIDASSNKAYLPAQVYAYIQRNNPKNVPGERNTWIATLRESRAHARSINKHGEFAGENTYAAELISCIGDYQSIYSYCFRLLQNHLTKEHAERLLESYQLPNNERTLFLERHKQPTFLAHVDALHAYANSMYNGNSFKFSAMIREVCDAFNVTINTINDERSDADKAIIQGSIESWQTKAEQVVLQWGIKRFEYLIKAPNYNTLSEEHDNSFYRQFIASSHPALKAGLIKKATSWHTQKDGYDGSHHKMWKIITWLGDANLIHLYASKRLPYIFEHNQELSTEDEAFIVQNKDVEGFLSQVSTTLYAYLNGENCDGRHNLYRNLVLWLKDCSVEKNNPDLKNKVESVINSYIDKRLTFLLSNNVALTNEDWDFLVKCKDVTNMATTVQGIIAQYITKKYDGTNTQFLDLILGYHQAFLGDRAIRGFLYQPYTSSDSAGNYLAKRLAFVMTKGFEFNVHETERLNGLFENADEPTTAVKNIVAQHLSKLIVSKKAIFWKASNDLKEEVVQSYTTRIASIVSNTNNARPRTTQQIELMQRFAEERLLVLMLKNRASLLEMPFFDACCSEALVKNSLSEMVIRNVTVLVKHKADFSYIAIINKLNADAIASYYIERFRHLLTMDIKTFPQFDKEALSDALKPIPLNNQLNEGIKKLVVACVDELHANPTNIQDRRIVELLGILELCKDNERFVAEQCASLLDIYLQNNIDPPDFFRDFCIKSNNAELHKLTDAVVKDHLRQHQFCIEWNAARPDNYVIDLAVFNHDKIDWYKTLSNYASDNTYDEVFVPLLNGVMRQSDKNSLHLINGKLEELSAKGNKAHQSIPVTEAGRQKLDAIITQHVYVDATSRPWNSAVCQVVHEKRCSDTVQDKYRCGELVRRLSPTLASPQIFNEFFKISDSANWGNSSVVPRINFVTHDQQRLNQAFNDCKQAQWHGNAQRVMDNYASPDLAVQYHTTWYLEQLMDRDERYRTYASQNDVNYSMTEDGNNKKRHDNEQMLLRDYGSGIEQIVARSLDFLKNMRLDKASALEVVEAHFGQASDNNKYHVQLLPFIKRYQFLMVEILGYWKSGAFADAKRKLLEISNRTIADRDAPVEGDDEMQIAARKREAEEHRLWLGTFLERGKYVAEEYTKQLLVGQHDIEASIIKAKAVAESFHNGLSIDHPYTNAGEYLVELQKITPAQIAALRKTYSAVCSLTKYVRDIAGDKVAQKLYDENVLDAINIDVLVTLTNNLPTHLLEKLSKDLAAAKLKAGPGTSIARIIILIEHVINTKGNSDNLTCELGRYIKAKTLAADILRRNTLNLAAVRNDIELCDECLLHNTTEYNGYIKFKEERGVDQSKAKGLAHSFKQCVLNATYLARKATTEKAKQMIAKEFNELMTSFDKIKANPSQLDLFITEFNYHPENRMKIQSDSYHGDLVRDELVQWKEQCLNNIKVELSPSASPAGSLASLAVVASSHTDSLRVSPNGSLTNLAAVASSTQSLPDVRKL